MIDPFQRLPDPYFNPCVDPGQPLTPEDFQLLKNALIGYSLRCSGDDARRADSLLVRFANSERDQALALATSGIHR